METYMHNLLHELVLHTTCYLDYRDTLSLSTTCQRFYELGKLEEIWLMKLSIPNNTCFSTRTLCKKFFSSGEPVIPTRYPKYHGKDRKDVIRVSYSFSGRGYYVCLVTYTGECWISHDMHQSILLSTNAHDALVEHTDNYVDVAVYQTSGLLLLHMDEGLVLKSSTFHEVCVDELLDLYCSESGPTLIYRIGTVVYKYANNNVRLLLRDIQSYFSVGYYNQAVYVCRNYAMLIQGHLIPEIVHLHYLKGLEKAVMFWRDDTRGFAYLANTAQTLDGNIVFSKSLVKDIGVESQCAVLALYHDGTLVDATSTVHRFVDNRVVWMRSTHYTLCYVRR